MIKVLLDGVDISNQTEIDLSYVEKLDRELDEGFIVISHTNRANQYPMFSTISIFEDSILLFSGRISSDMVELSSFDSNIYNHNITLVEHTKILEKFFVKGKKFSQPLTINEPKYTLYDVVDILRKTIKFEKTGQEQINAPYNIPQETRDKLENIIAPELYFNDVTLRQALDTVGDYVNSISRLKVNGNLVFDNFNELLEEVNIITENYKKQQNINNYQTFMSTDVLNAVNNREVTNNLSFEYYPGKDLWTTLRSSFGLFDFENSIIPTHKPIYEILEVKNAIDLVVVKSNQAQPEGATTEDLIREDLFPLDIGTNVVEENIYATYEDREPNSYDDLTKRNTIVYQYASKGIKIGFTYGLFDISTNYNLVLESNIERYLKENNIIPQNATAISPPSTFDIGFTFDGDYYWINYSSLGGLTPSISTKRWEGLFRIKYIPIPPSIRYEVVRDDISEVNIETFGISNQKLRIVDLQSFANNMKGRINQLSESQLTLSHKVSSINDSYKVGDFTADKFVITKKEVIVQRDHYIINYELNKNFNKVSQFVGIDQEIRQWEIGESGRTLDRDLNYNEFIEVYATDNDLGASGNITLLGESLFLSTFDENYSGEGLSYGIFSSPQVLDEEGNVLEINLPLYRVYGGNAFGFYTDFETNASAGNSLDEGDENFFDYVLNRKYNVPLKYTNELGRFETMFITAHNNSLAIQQGTFEQEVEFANLLPEFTKTPGGTVISGNFYVSKDAQERLKLTLLYHLISKNIDEVIIGDKLSSHNTLFINTPNTIKIRVWNNDKTFITRDKNVSHTDQDVIYDGDSLIINDTFNYIQVDEDLTNAVAWAITDENGFPFVMVNGNKKRLVFEFNNKRSGVKYKLFAPQFFEEFDTGFTIDTEVSETSFLYKFFSESFESDINIESEVEYQSIVYQFEEESFETVINFDFDLSFEEEQFLFIQSAFTTQINFDSDTSGTQTLIQVESGGVEDEFTIDTITSGTQFFPEPTYDITFNPNGGTWSDGSTTIKIVVNKEEGDTISSAPMGLSRTGFNFLGWSPSLPYTVGNSDDTLSAQWQTIPKWTVRVRSNVPDTAIQLTTPNEQFQGIIGTSYTIIDDDITASGTYSITGDADLEFTESGVTYTFNRWELNGVSYFEESRTFSGLSGDSDLEVFYTQQTSSSGGGGGDPLPPITILP